MSLLKYYSTNSISLTPMRGTKYCPTLIVLLFSIRPMWELTLMAYAPYNFGKWMSPISLNLAIFAMYMSLWTCVLESFMPLP